MTNKITVTFRGQMMSVYRAVADKLDLKNGQVIRDEKHFWEILAANASFGISLSEHAMQTTPN